MAASVLVGGDREGLVLTLNGNNTASAGSGRAVRNVFVVEPSTMAEDIHISQAAAIAWRFRKKFLLSNSELFLFAESESSPKKPLNPNEPGMKNDKTHKGAFIWIRAFRICVAYFSISQGLAESLHQLKHFHTPTRHFASFIRSHRPKEDGKKHFSNVDEAKAQMRRKAKENSIEQ